MRNGRWKMRTGWRLLSRSRASHFSFFTLHFSLLILAGVGGKLSAADDTKPKYVGGSSCAAAMCHGGGIGQKYLGAEHLHWSDRDRHATKAYQVLLNDVSQQMAKQLGLPKPAHESDVCLNCHSPATASTAQSLPGRRQATGVGCEQCHGAAERWLKPHVNWKKMKPEEVEAEKKALGYRDLINVVTRSNICADCHVGEPGREVNHDLIAAGHPRLFFEMSAFHANYPRHWSDEVDAKRHPSNPVVPDQPGSLLEAKLWAVGQVVTAQRSLELLSHRTANAKNASARWPELAEFNCFACHHDLRSESQHADSLGVTRSWRQARGADKRQRVLFEWNAWPYAMLEPLARQTTGPDLSLLAKLRTHFVTLAPQADVVSRDAADAAKVLAAWADQLNRGSITPIGVEKLRQTLVAEDGQKLVGRDWDSATQVFMSLNALHYSAITARAVVAQNDAARDRQIQSLLEAMNDKLNFEPKLNSPSEFVPRADDSNDPLQSDLRSLQKLLGAP